MSIEITPTPTGPIEAIELAPEAKLRQGAELLATAPERARLLPAGQPEDRSAGPVGTRAQTRQSFAILRFYLANPDLAPLFQAAQPERHRYLTGVRLYAGQGRAVMERVQAGVEATDVIVRGQMTEDCDLIEDSFTEEWRASQTPPERRRYLEARFKDPMRLRQMAAESQEQKRARRQGRKLLRASARSEAERLRQAPRDVERLRGLDPRGVGR